MLNAIRRFLCRKKGHDWLWHCLGYPGDGRTCHRCGLNETWPEYWRNKEARDAS